MALHRQTVIAVIAILMVYGWLKSSQTAVSTTAGANFAAVVDSQNGAAGAEQQPAISAAAARLAGVTPHANRLDGDGNVIETAEPAASSRRAVDSPPDVLPRVDGPNSDSGDSNQRRQAASPASGSGVDGASSSDAAPKPPAPKGTHARSLRPAFESWLTDNGCRLSPRTTRRDERVMEPVWHGSVPDPNTPINNANDPAGGDQVAAFMARYSALTTPPSLTVQEESKGQHLLVVYGTGNVQDWMAQMSQFFAKTFVVGGRARKMKVQACNDESWLRIITCVAHLVTGTHGASYESVTLVNIVYGADNTQSLGHLTPMDHESKDRWACTVSSLLSRRKQLIFSMHRSPKNVSDVCKMSAFAEDTAYWLSNAEYDGEWSSDRSALLKVVQDDSEAVSDVDLSRAASDPSYQFGMLHGRRHDLRLLHIPVGLFPMFTLMADGWRIFDVAVEDGIALFLDLLAINAHKVGVEVKGSLSFHRPGSAKLLWEVEDGNPECDWRASKSDRDTVDAWSPTHEKRFLDPKYTRTQWFYPLIHAPQAKPGPSPELPDVSLPGVPKSWQVPRRQRSPALFVMVKNPDIANRRSVHGYIASLQRHFRRVLVMTTKGAGELNAFVPHTTAFCGCNNDYVGCMNQFYKLRFFQRAGGIVFMHGDAFFAPKEWMDSTNGNNMRHIVTSKEHPFTEGLDGKSRWKRATQGPTWVWDDHFLSAVRGRRPATGFAHLRDAQSEWGSFFRPYLDKSSTFKESVENSVPNVVFGDLHWEPAQVLDVVALTVHHTFPHMILSEPMSGWSASLSSVITGTPRDGFSYTGGCCFGNEVPKIRHSPAGHRIDLNKQSIVSAVQKRVEDSYSCDSKAKLMEALYEGPRQSDKAAYESFSSTTCAITADASIATKEYELELVAPNTNDVTVVLMPDETVKEAKVTIILFTTNVNAITIKGRKQDTATIELTLMVATGVWQPTTIVSRTKLLGSSTADADESTDDNGASQWKLPQTLDEDRDTLVVKYTGVLDAMTVDVDTSSSTKSSVVVEGGETVSKSGISINIPKRRLED